MPRENKRKKPSLTVQITISLLIGIVAGIAMQSIPDIAEGYVKPFGTIYLNLIKMIVVPVVVLSIIQGIVSLQDVRQAPLGSRPSPSIWSPPPLPSPWAWWLPTCSRWARGTPWARKPSPMNRQNP